MVIPEIKTHISCKVNDVIYKTIIDFIDSDELDSWEIDSLIVESLRDAGLDIHFDSHLDYRGFEEVLLTDYPVPIQYQVHVSTVLLYKGQVFRLPRID